MQNKRLTYKQSIDGYTDVGLCEGVTIDEAICKLADYEEAERWIPVTERLPTEEDAIDGGFVFANTEKRVIIALWSDVCRFSEFVTHWMPLPEPPKGDQV